MPRGSERLEERAEDAQWERAYRAEEAGGDQKVAADTPCVSPTPRIAWTTARSRDGLCVLSAKHHLPPLSRTASAIDQPTSSRLWVSRAEQRRTLRALPEADFRRFNRASVLRLR